MCPFKHMEHEGDENIADVKQFSNRTRAKIDLIIDKAALDKADIDAKVKAQEEYLSVENDLLFDGDVG